MSSELKLRRGNTSATSTFTGALAEVTVDTDKYVVVVHDGTTAGGYPLAKFGDVTAANVGMLGYVNNLVFGGSGGTFGNTNVKAYLGQFDSNISPSANAVYSLGSITNQWKDLYVSNNTIYIGGASLTITNGNLIINGTDQTASISSANVGMKGYVDQANVTLKSYVDGQISAANAGVTSANLGMQGYVDNAVSTANIGIKGYIDQGNSIQATAITTANVGMQGYVDAVSTAWTANAYQQQALIGNLIASGYSNINVAAYLPGYTGTIGASLINSSGNILGTTGTFGTLYLNSTTNATDTTSGALQIAGGAGFAKDVWIGGNLYVANIYATSYNVLTVNDPLLYLTAANTYPYNYEIGMYSQFTGGTGNIYQHSGVARDHNDAYWKFFSNVVAEPTGTIAFNSDTKYDGVKAGNLILTDTGTAISAVGFINTTGNISAAVGLFGAVNSTGFINTSGNVSASAVNASTGAFTSVTTPSVTATTNDLTLSAISTGNVTVNTPNGTAFKVLPVSATSSNWLQVGNPSTTVIRLGPAGTTVADFRILAPTFTSFHTGSSADGLSDGSQQFRVSHTASAVNYVQVTGSATGNSPVISVQGSDATRGLGFQVKGGAYTTFYNQGGTVTVFSTGGTNASNGNYLSAVSNASGSSPSLAGNGVDTNISITLTPKGTGNVNTTANIVTTSYFIGSGALLTELPGYAYSNVNVKAYTESMGFANYSNVNVAAYVTTNGLTNYSNVNTKAYTESMGFQNYGNVNVSALITTNGLTNYSNVNTKAYTESMGFANYGNVNVAAYLTTNGYALDSGLSVYAWNANVTNYSNVNTAAYTQTMGFTNYSNVNVAAYVTTNGLTNYSNVNATALVTSLGHTNYSNVNVAAYLNTQGYNLYSNVNVAAYLASVQTTQANIKLGPSGNIVFADGTVQTTAGSGAITVSEINTANTITNTYSSITAIRFDKDTGFTVSNIGGGAVKVSLGSSFKTWVVAGQANLVAQGEDTVEFIAGAGISFTTNANANPKSLTITSSGGGSYSNVQVATYLPTYSGNIANVTLGSSGILTFPDGTTQTTAAAGGGSSYGNGNVASYLTSTQVTIANVKLGPSGNITFADGTVQTTAGGGGSTANVNLIYSSISDNTANLANVGNTQLIDSYSTLSYRTAKYIIQATATEAVSVHASEILVTHNDTNVYISQNNTIVSDANLFTVSGNIVSGNVNVYADTTTSNIIIDFVRVSLIARSMSTFDLYGDLMLQSGAVDLMVGSGSEDLDTFDYNDDLEMGGGSIDLLSQTGSVDLNT